MVCEFRALRKKNTHHNVALRCRVGLSSISSRLHLCDLSILLRLGSLCLFRGFLCSLSDLYDAATVACSSFVLLLATAFCVVVLGLLLVLPILLLLCRFLGLAAIAPLLLFVASLFGLQGKGELTRQRKEVVC